MSRGAFLLNILLILCFVIASTNGRRYRSVNKKEAEILDKHQRNAECCRKQMRCCVKPPQPPIVIRALLARCPNIGHENIGSLSRKMNKPVYPANEAGVRSFQGFDEDEPLVQSRVTQCMRKVLMTLKIRHSGTIQCSNQFVVVDHVYDPVTEKTVRLLNPYVIKLKEEPVAKAFHLQFIDYVNSEAREQIYNKHDGNYTGCYTSRYKSTCGVVKYNGEVIPFSEGFCCSCDTKLNNARQPDSINTKNEEIVSASDPTYLLERVSCPRNYFDDNKTDVTDPDGHGAVGVSRREAQTTQTRWKYTTYEGAQHSTPKSYLKSKRSDDEANTDPQPAFLERMMLNQKRKDPKSYIEVVKKSHSAADLVDNVLKDLSSDDDGFFSNSFLRKRRQIFPSGIQKRGGQNCADRFTPPGLDPDHYHESTHCLRFSDVWYGVYKLGASSVEHTTQITIYERYEGEFGGSTWRDITNGTVLLSDLSPIYEDALPTISLQFSSKILSDPARYNQLSGRRILIPEGIKPSEMNKYPEMRGGPAEYLVVKQERISLEGDQCDKIGVGFEAFVKQPQRCSMPAHTCLFAQPKHLWRYDKRSERKGRKGCYFLKYHANLTSAPLVVNQTTGQKNLLVVYNGAQLSTIDIEIKADFNMVIREIASAVITEVYVDATCNRVTFITIKIINTGLIAARFYVQLSDFPLEVPEYYSRVKSKIELIAPQTVHVFTLEIKDVLPSDLMFCSVEVLNDRKELVALRRVRIQKYDRCICTWYCLCACVASSEGIICNPMSLEHYHAAGFEGSLPIVTYMVHFTMLDDILSLVVYFALFLLGILMLMGLLKALIGLCCYTIGIWGLPVILDLPKPMKHYYERHLKNYSVVYDKNGWPMDPETFEPARNISKSTEFCANLVFFFTYPLACTMIILKRLCCPYYTKTRRPATPCDDICSKSTSKSKSIDKMKNKKSESIMKIKEPPENTKTLGKSDKIKPAKHTDTGSKIKLKSCFHGTKKCPKDCPKFELDNSKTGSENSSRVSNPSTSSGKYFRSKGRLVTAFAFPKLNPLFPDYEEMSGKEPKLLPCPEKFSSTFPETSSSVGFTKPKVKREKAHKKYATNRKGKSPSTTSGSTTSPNEKSPRMRASMPDKSIAQRVVASESDGSLDTTSSSMFTSSVTNTTPSADGPATTSQKHLQSRFPPSVSDSVQSKRRKGPLKKAATKTSSLFSRPKSM